MSAAPAPPGLAGPSGPRIMKFGGAALRDGPGLARVAAIVAAAQGPRVVVASAMEGVTDLLAASVADVRRDEGHVFVLVESLRERHAAALAHVAPAGDEAAQYALAANLERLERLLYGIAYTQELTARLWDLVLSFGERLSAPLAAAALRARGMTAVALDAEHAGLRTLGPFGNARPDLQALRREATTRLGPHLDAGSVPVVTGFYGVDAEGHATLFGRGGSDYVAALLGFALRAQCVELWKDVPGFLSADPRAVPDARLVPELGYDEAAELAHFGAKVLHARAVEPVEPAGIPIHIRSFHDPDARGSVIHAGAAAAAPLVRSVASKDRLAILRLSGPGMAHTPGVGKRVFDALAERGINVLNMATSQASFALLLEEADLERAHEALRPLVGGVIQGMDRLPGRSLVCVVGRGLGATPGSAARILQAVGDKGVNIEMISLGASDIAIDFIVPSQDRLLAMQGIHEAFQRAPADGADRADGDAGRALPDGQRPAREAPA